MTENQKAEKTPTDITRKVVRDLHNAGAHKWTIQDKGVLLAAVKLQLSGRGNNAT